MNSPAAASPPSRIELEVRRARGLLQGRQFHEALRAAEALCAEVPENRDALYLLAMSQRHLNALPEALATLALLERHHPGFSRLYQERGNCYVAQRNAPMA
jgi:tetratricopeptide (TPR) repeat protein